MAKFDRRSCRIYDDVRDSKIQWDIISNFDRKTDSSKYGRVFPRSFKEDDTTGSGRVGRELHHSRTAGDNRRSSMWEVNRRWVRSCLPIFRRTSNKKDLFNWFDEVGRFFEETQQPEKTKCELASYVLGDEAGRWWQQLQHQRLLDGESESIIIRFKRNLPVFDGFWHTGDLLSWIDAIDDFFGEIRPPEHIKCKIVWSKMKGRAYYWWKQTQQERNEEVPSWALMKQMILDRFTPTTCSTKCPEQIYSSRPESAIKDDGTNNSSSAGTCYVEDQSEEVIGSKPTMGSTECLVRVNEKEEGSKEIRSEADLSVFVGMLDMEIQALGVVGELRMKSANSPPMLALCKRSKENISDDHEVKVEHEAIKDKNLDFGSEVRNVSPKENTKLSKIFMEEFDPGGQWQRKVKMDERTDMVVSRVSTCVGFGKDQKLFSRVLDDLYCVVGSDDWKTYGFCSLVCHFNLKTFGEVEHVNFDPGGKRQCGLGMSGQVQDLYYVELLHSLGTSVISKGGTELRILENSLAFDFDDFATKKLIERTASKHGLDEAIMEKYIWPYVAQRCKFVAVGAVHGEMDWFRVPLYWLKAMVVILFDPDGTSWTGRSLSINTSLRNDKLALLLLQNGFVVLRNYDQKHAIVMRDEVVYRGIPVHTPIDSLEELQVNEASEAAGSIRSKHTDELQLLEQGLVDDSGQLYGASVTLNPFQVLISNLLAWYRIVIAELLLFMFDPGGNCRRSFLRCCIFDNPLDNYYVDGTRGFNDCLNYRGSRTQKKYDLKDLNVPNCELLVDMLFDVAHICPILTWKPKFGYECTELVELECHSKRRSFGYKIRTMCVWELEKRQYVKGVCGCTYLVVSLALFGVTIHCLDQCKNFVCLAVGGNQVMVSQTVFRFTEPCNFEVFLSELQDLYDSLPMLKLCTSRGFESSSFNLLKFLSLWCLYKIHVKNMVFMFDRGGSPYSSQSCGLKIYSYHDPNTFSRNETTNESISVMISYLGIEARSKSKCGVESLVPTVTYAALMLDEIIKDHLVSVDDKCCGVWLELTAFGAPQHKFISLYVLQLQYLGPTVNVLLSFDPGGTVYLSNIQRSMCQLCLTACFLFVFNMIPLTIALLIFGQYKYCKQSFKHKQVDFWDTNKKVSTTHGRSPNMLESTYVKCSLRTGIDFNLTRGRVIALEGWNDESNSNTSNRQCVVAMSLCLDVMYRNGTSIYSIILGKVRCARDEYIRTRGRVIPWEVRNDENDSNYQGKFFMTEQSVVSFSQCSSCLNVHSGTCEVVL